MRVLFDENLPHDLISLLGGYEVVTVQGLGWAGIKNGALLRLVAADFDVFITSDKNLAYQQNLAELPPSVIVLPSNQVPLVEALLPKLDAALTVIGEQDLVEL